MERLQKVLAHAGIASRRACEELITAGRVTVNGQVVTTLGTQVTPGQDVLAVDGAIVATPPPAVYIMLNKPAGYVSTTTDPQGRRTVLDLVKNTSAPRLYPVGRLDVDSEGLLILTNDGAFTQRLTHPSFEMEKEYLAVVDGAPTEADLARLRAGIPLDGKPAPVDEVAVVERSRTGAPTTRLRVVLHEGRQREVRRLFDAIGYRVQSLQRVRQGALQLGDLPVGSSRRLTGSEVAQLMSSTRRPADRPPRAAAPTRPHQPTRRPHAAQKEGQQHHHD